MEWCARLGEPVAYPQVEVGHREVVAEEGEDPVPSVVSYSVCESQSRETRTEQQTSQDQTPHPDRISTSSS